MEAEQKDLVSIIIPVYNVESLVKRCINSVQKQKYKNIEVIIVDDGSTDASKTVCDEMALLDSRLTVIHKSNGGLSSARNIGIKAAHGKYIAFVDSDDFIHEDYILVMHNIAVESGAKMVICNYEKGRSATFSASNIDNSYNLYTSEQMLKNWHGELWAQETPSWNKLIAVDVLSKIDFKFPEGFFYEDISTSHLLVCGADNVAITDRKLYYYYQRKNSITKQLRNEKNIKDNLAAQDNRLDFFKKKEYEGAIHRLMIGRQKYYMLMFCMTDSQKMKIKLKMLFRDYYKLIVRFGEVTWIEKVMFCIFKTIFIHDNSKNEII